MRASRRAQPRAALVELLRGEVATARREVGAQLAAAVTQIEEREDADAARLREATATAAAIVDGARAQWAVRQAEHAASLERLVSACDDLVAHLEVGAADDLALAFRHSSWSGPA